MSYPFGQFPGENYSAPPTPLDVFPPWESIESEEQRRQQQQPQQQQQQQQQQSSASATPQYQTIQLEEPPHLVPSQDDAPVRLHPVHVPERRREEDELRAIIGGPQQRQQHQQTTHAAPQAGPVRQTRSSHQAHPYRRPSSATSSAAASTPRSQREQHVRFAGGGSGGRPSSVSSAMHSPMTGFGPGSGLNSPITAPDVALPPSISRTTSATTATAVAALGTRLRPYIIRTDTSYDPESKVLTAMLELPGVKKADVRVTLSTCTFNRVRQITVSGRTSPAFPPMLAAPLPPPPTPTPASASSVASDAGAAAVAAGALADFTVRERKFGVYSRTFPVPPDLKCEDIDASMEDGILVLRFPCSPPVPPDAEDVPVH